MIAPDFLAGGFLAGELSAVVLAAGAGRRFGGAKLLAPYGGRPLIGWALATALAAPVAEVVTTVPALDDPLAEAVRGLSKDARLRLVPVPDRDEGMAASLRAAVAALSPASQGVLVFLGDMPRVPAGIGAELVGALAAAGPAGALAAQPLFDGQPGHPALLARALYPQLLALAGDQGARAVLAGLGARRLLVPTTDLGVLFDIDRPEQLQG